MFCPNCKEDTEEIVDTFLYTSVPVGYFNVTIECSDCQHRFFIEIDFPGKFIDLGPLEE